MLKNQSDALWKLEFLNSVLCDEDLFSFEIMFLRKQQNNRLLLGFFPRVNFVEDGFLER